MHVESTNNFNDSKTQTDDQINKESDIYVKVNKKEFVFSSKFRFVFKFGSTAKSVFNFLYSLVSNFFSKTYMFFFAYFTNNVMPFIKQKTSNVFAKATNLFCQKNNKQNNLHSVKKSVKTTENSDYCTSDADMYNIALYLEEITNSS